MSLGESHGKCFTFLWKLENASFCLEKEGEKIKSPTFEVNAIEKTKWNLSVYPREGKDGDHIECYLSRKSDSKGADPIEIRYELAFIANDGSVYAPLGIPKANFLKGAGFGFSKFRKREDVFTAKRSSFLPQDIIRARCRIWKSVGEMTEDVQCIALTHIGVEKKSIKWNVKNFTSLASEKKCTYQINSVVSDVPLMSVGLSLTGGLNSDENISFELFLQDRTIKFSALKLFLIDCAGNSIECNQEEFWFDDPTQYKQFTFSFSKKTLLEKKNEYLPNDNLSLLWEWAFSKGVASVETEEDKHGCICPEVKISDAKNVNNDETTPFNALVGNMKSLYDDHFLSDVKLKTDTNVFPTHKFVLSAQSSVFKGMFSNDMKENDSGCVNIEDLSDDTVSRMLSFMYTTRVEDLTWDRASRLYVAADKYAIFNLKDICSSYLKDNLSPFKACEILLLSDFHADDDLKSAVQNYMLKHGKQITNSDEWKTLVETNAKLAVETLCLLFK
ncbi:unnamed protein product [Larinioides sclopetarius]|uniref:Speckle-type POZ protein n=1 Tax=Larinioides sclopetarius TaxID=280406 RepID=A0AAV2BFD6_9ARAC